MSNTVGLTDTQENYARAVIGVGVRLGATAAQTCAALATCLVESNFTMYANPRVSGSVDFPHDKVANPPDALSVGIFQQQVPLWGPVTVCQDAVGSANLFYQQLLRVWNSAKTIGENAQRVQGSAYPARYDERYADAERIYNDLIHSVSTASVGAATPIESDAFTMADNKTLEQIVNILKVSAEPVVSAKVNQIYEVMLGRKADPEGLRTYTQYILNGGNTLEVQNAIAASTEYKRRHG
jgi:hypothetical protein